MSPRRYRAEQLALAFGLTALGCWTGGVLVAGWMSRTIDRALADWGLA